MSRTIIRLCAVLLLVVCAPPLLAQQLAAVNSSTSNATVVPPLVSFSGVLTDVNGKPMTGAVGVTFALYKDEQSGGAPLWLETQNVYPDKTGHYTVLLGATTSSGLPPDLFAAGEARWLGVQVQGQAEQPRVLLTSVPYSLKAADAQTVGGLPASAFVLAAPPASGAAAATSSSESAASSAVTSATASNVTTSGGTADTIPLFTTATNIQNSILTQTSTTAINVGGKLNLPATGTATATAGYKSWPQDFVASAYNSSTATAVPETFQWQAEPVGNDTASPSGTLNLLFGSGTATPAGTGVFITSGGALSTHGLSLPAIGTASSSSTAGFTSRPLDLYASSWDTSGTPAAVSQHFRWQAEPAGSDTASPSGTMNLLYASGTATPAETGLKISSKGLLTFASGQTFPGTGTITGITTAAGSGLKGGGTSGTLNLGLVTTCSSGQLLKWNGTAWACAADLNSGGTVTSVGSGSGLTGGPITSTGTLSIASGGVTNAMLANPSLTVTAGNGLSGGGAVALGSSVTLNNAGILGVGVGPGITTTGGQTPTLGINATVVAELNANNSFTGNQSVTGNIGVVDGVPGDTGLSVQATDLGLTAPNTAINGLADGLGGAGVIGEADNGPTAAGVWGISQNGVAGLFSGNVDITGNLSKSGGSFKIDDPIDPANKYLYHSFVESPDMKNVYDGVVTLDALGEAVVQLPEWFEALNKDFRYQLTCIGAFAPVYIAEKINQNHFKIAGGKLGLEVSWQVTGIRQDAWANAHRIPVEVAKPAQEHGYYIHPELFGQPAQKNIEWAEHPQQMKKVAARNP